MMNSAPVLDPLVPASGGTEVFVHHPVIVIGIPCYNEERFLGRAIASLQAQTWTDFAVLIADNASTDRSGEIAAAAAANDQRFHYHRHERNRGSAANFNFTLEASDSPLMMWLGAHDFIAPTFLERHVTAMRADPRLSVSYSYAAWVDEDGKVFRVTKSEGMDRVPDIPLVRAVLTARQIDDYCTEMYQVLRRRLLRTPLKDVWGCDLILLADLAYRGPFHCVPEELYFCLREPDEVRVESRMKRLTGKDVPEDVEGFIEAFLAHLKRIAPRDPLRPLLSILARGLLEKRFTPHRTGIAAHALKSLGSVKQWWRTLAHRA